VILRGWRPIEHRRVKPRIARDSRWFGNQSIRFRYWRVGRCAFWVKSRESIRGQFAIACSDLARYRIATRTVQCLLTSKFADRFHVCIVLRNGEQMDTPMKGLDLRSRKQGLQLFLSVLGNDVAVRGPCELIVAAGSAKGVPRPLLQPDRRTNAGRNQTCFPGTVAPKIRRLVRSLLGVERGLSAMLLPLFRLIWKAAGIAPRLEPA
jgi:hypothetical protein